MKLPKVYASQKTDSLIDMTLSTNPLGCSPEVLIAMSKIGSAEISDYPSEIELKKSIAKLVNTKSENVLLGSGSEQLIKLLAQTLIATGDLAFIQQGSFPLFTKEIKLAGGNIEYFDPNNLESNLKPKLIILSNPSTPTGEVFSQDVIEELLINYPESILVVDEANGEYINKSSIQYINNRENVIVLKTFSKVYGLAGLRIGFAIGKGKVFDSLVEAQQPFGVSSVACMLTQAAISDQDFVERSKAFVKDERNLITKKLRALGFEVSNSSTNNLFISGNNIENVLEKLIRAGVGVIDNSYFPELKTKGFRISIKDKATNQKFLSVIEKIVS